MLTFQQNGDGQQVYLTLKGVEKDEIQTLLYPVESLSHFHCRRIGLREDNKQLRDQHFLDFGKTL